MPASGLAGLPVFGMVSLSSVGAVSDGHGKAWPFVAVEREKRLSLLLGLAGWADLDFSG